MRAPVELTLKDGENEHRIRITPMSAVKAERFVYRCLFTCGMSAAMMQASDNSVLIAKALQEMNGLPYEKAQPLFNELLECCELVTGENTAIKITEETADGIFDYPTTLFLLRFASLKATYGFFENGGWQNFLSGLPGVLSAIK